VVISDPPPGESGWAIDITEGVQSGKTVRLHNCAISTSGDVEQFVEYAGKRYSHVVDPRTGWALTNRVEATVIAPHGIDTDALSTAMCVMGKQNGEALARQYGAQTYIRELKE
jgi:thiamine biosynthesis lipoprotein